MDGLNFKDLHAGDEITVVQAWNETTTFEDIANGHFFKTKITNIYFEPKGNHGFLRIFALDGDGQSRRVNWILENNQVKSAAVVIPLNELRPDAELICLNDRPAEFASAISRGLDAKLDVYADWEKDIFHVINRGNRKDYEVTFKTINGKAFGKCSCPDFQMRKRICKHQTRILKELAFTNIGKFSVV